MDHNLLQILACPHCKASLQLSTEQDGLICCTCQMVYPIIDNIPVLLVEKGIPLGDWNKGKRDEDQMPDNQCTE